MSVQRSRSVCWRYIPNGAYVGSPYSASEGVQIIYNKRARFDGTEPVIIALHGHSGTAYANGVPFPTFAHQCLEFVRAGYIVVAIDHGGTRAWPSPLVDQVVLNAYNWAVTPKTDDEFLLGLGGKPGKVGVYGYSMGGGVGLSFARLHPTLVAFCLAFAPAINLDVFASPEIDVLYAGSAFTYASGSATVNTSPSSVLCLDTTNLPSSGTIDRLSSTSVVTFNYSGKDPTHLLNCSVPSGSVPISNGNVLARAGLYTGHEGYNAHYDATIGRWSPSNYQIPTRIYHGSADTTVVPSTIDQWLLDAANPGYLDRTLLPGASHTDLFQQVASERDIPWLANYLS